MKQCEYKEALKSVKRPSRITLAVSKSDDGPANIITLEWFMRTSIDPPMFAISVGLSRYSYELLSDNRKFVLAFPSEKMAEASLKCGTYSGKNVDKIKEYGIQTSPGKLSEIPILEDAISNFECKTISQIRSGDHTIFIGEVKYSWKNEDESLKPLLSIPNNDKFESLISKSGYSMGKLK